MNSKLRPVVALLLGGFALALAARGSVSATSSPRSPDSHLLIVSDRDGDNDVYGVNAALPRLPGSHLLFVSDRDGDNDVYGVSADAHRQVALTRNRVKDDEAVVSPDGRWFAVERGYRGAVLVAANGRRERKLGESTTPHLFSPNGRLLLFTHYSAADVLSMRLLPVDGGRVRRLGPGFPRSFSPNGGAVAWSDDYGRVGVTQLPTLARRLLAGSAGASAIAWSRDGTRIAIEKRRERIEADLYTVYVSDVRRPDRPPKTILTASSSLEAQWLRGGKLGFIRFALYREGGQVGTVDPSSGHLTVIEQHGEWPLWSPRGDRVAYTRRPTSSRELVELVLASIDGSQKRVLHRGDNPQALWSPSGRRLAVSDGRMVFVFDIATGRSSRITRKLRGATLQAWSPDENYLALSGGRGGLQVASVKPPFVRSVFPGGNWQVLGWVPGALPRSSPAAVPPPRIETATAHLLSSRGKITEIASDGPRVAALVAKSRLDCDHVVGWTPSTGSIFRADQPWSCDDVYQTWFNLRLVGTKLRWQDYWCGNECNVADRSADFRVPYRQQSSEQQQSIDHKPSRPSPQPETRRGIQMTVNRTTITLRRLADRRTRTIRPPSGVVDAELENGGLFYAFNARRTTMPGRLVFVPFPDLVR